MERGWDILSRAGDYHQHPLPVGGPHFARRKFGWRYDSDRPFDAIDYRAARLAGTVNDEQHFAVALTYPEVNSQYPIREIQVERALAKYLDGWINFETYPLFKSGFAKALQAPTQLQAVRLDDARAGRPCARNSSAHVASVL